MEFTSFGGFEYGVNIIYRYLVYCTQYIHSINLAIAIIIVSLSCFFLSLTHTHTQTHNYHIFIYTRSNYYYLGASTSIKWVLDKSALVLLSYSTRSSEEDRAQMISKINKNSHNSL